MAIIKLNYVIGWLLCLTVCIGFYYILLMRAPVYDIKMVQSNVISISAHADAHLLHALLPRVINTDTIIESNADRLRIHHAPQSEVFVHELTDQILQVRPHIYVHKISNPFHNIHGDNLTVFHPAIIDSNHISFCMQKTNKLLGFFDYAQRPKHCEYITEDKLFTTTCYVYKDKKVMIARGIIVFDLMGCKCALNTAINISRSDLWLKMLSTNTGKAHVHYFALAPKPQQFKYNISISVQNIVRAHWNYGPIPSYLVREFLNYYIIHGVNAFYLYDIKGDLSTHWNLFTWQWAPYTPYNQQVDIFIYNTLSCLDQYPLFKDGQYSALTSDDFPRKAVHDFKSFQYAVQIHSFYEKLHVSEWNMVIDLDEYLYIPKQDAIYYHINDHLLPYLEQSGNHIAEIPRYRMNESVCVVDTNYSLNTVHVRSKHRDGMPKSLYKTEEVGFYAVHWAFSKNETYDDFDRWKREKKVVNETVVQILHFRYIMNRDRCRYQFKLSDTAQICQYLRNTDQCYFNNSNLFIHKRDVMDMDRNLACTCEASYPEIQKSHKNSLWSHWSGRSVFNFNSAKTKSNSTFTANKKEKTNKKGKSGGSTWSFKSKLFNRKNKKSEQQDY
eukprot:291135_1